MNVAASSTTDLIIADKRDGVGYLRFNRPEKHNAISYEMWQGIAKVMADFEADDADSRRGRFGRGWQGVFCRVRIYRSSRSSAHRRTRLRGTTWHRGSPTKN